MEGLDPQESKFVRLLFEGVEYVAAYKQCGWGRESTPASLQVAANRKKNSTPIRMALRELNDEVNAALVLSKIDKRILLAEIALGKEILPSSEFLFKVAPKHSERISAIAEDNRLAGDLSPEEHNLSLNGDILAALLNVKGVNDDGDKGEK